MTTKSTMTHLECGRCGTTYAANQLMNLCPACGKPLLVRYDLQKAAQTMTKAALKTRAASLWRYEEVLPVQRRDAMISLGEGWTPLHWAAFHGNLGMAQALLCHSPPLEATDADFHGTPLGWAIHGSEHGWYAQTGDYAATVDALLQAGARPPAQQGGSLAVREALRRHGT